MGWPFFIGSMLTARDSCTLFVVHVSGDELDHLALGPSRTSTCKRGAAHGAFIGFA
ncbi:hypothetical protein BH11MYX4_BH11MYX4_28170 [soil metagenome]